jgi:hypothetical protein
MDRDVSEGNAVSIFRLQLRRARNMFRLYRYVAMRIIAQTRRGGGSVDPCQNKLGVGSERTYNTQ